MPWISSARNTEEMNKKEWICVMFMPFIFNATLVVSLFMCLCMGIFLFQAPK